MRPAVPARARDRGQVTIEFLGMTPTILVTLVVLWQLVLVGYTFVLAGNAADEAVSDEVLVQIEDVGIGRAAALRVRIVETLSRIGVDVRNAVPERRVDRGIAIEAILGGLRIALERLQDLQPSGFLFGLRAGRRLGRRRCHRRHRPADQEQRPCDDRRANPQFVQHVSLSFLQ